MSFANIFPEFFQPQDSQNFDWTWKLLEVSDQLKEDEEVSTSYHD